MVKVFYPSPELLGQFYDWLPSKALAGNAASRGLPSVPLRKPLQKVHPLSAGFLGQPSALQAVGLLASPPSPLPLLARVEARPFGHWEVTGRSRRCAETVGADLGASSLGWVEAGRCF